MEKKKELMSELSSLRKEWILGRIVDRAKQGHTHVDFHFKVGQKHRTELSETEIVALKEAGFNVQEPFCHPEWAKLRVSWGKVKRELSNTDCWNFLEKISKEV